LQRKEKKFLPILSPTAPVITTPTSGIVLTTDSPARHTLIIVGFGKIDYDNISFLCTDYVIIEKTVRFPPNSKLEYALSVAEIVAEEKKLQKKETKAQKKDTEAKKKKEKDTEAKKKKEKDTEAEKGDDTIKAVKSKKRKKTGTGTETGTEKEKQNVKERRIKAGKRTFVVPSNMEIYVLGEEDVKIFLTEPVYKLVVNHLLNPDNHSKDSFIAYTRSNAIIL